MNYLVKDRDYTLAFPTAEYILVGTKEITINGIGNYCGSKTVSYSIIAAPVEGPTTIYYFGGTSAQFSNATLTWQVLGKPTSSTDTTPAMLSAYGSTRCTMIWSSAFCNCQSLTIASFPKCSSIHMLAFMSCTLLATISFPECINIGVRAFESCHALQLLILSSLISLSARAFANCINLTTVSISRVTDILANTFIACSKLTDVSIPACQQVYQVAFANCTSLSTISIPNCISLSASAFLSCTALMSVYFSGSTYITMVSNTVFSKTPMKYSSYTGAFGSIFVPFSMYASYYCRTNWTYYKDRLAALTPTFLYSYGIVYYSDGTSVSMALPSILTNTFIGSYVSNSSAIAFYCGSGCTSTSSFVFNLYVKSLTTVYFQSCTALNRRTFTMCQNIATISFPNCVSIYSEAFFSCDKLHSLTLPDTVTTISSRAFAIPSVYFGTHNMSIYTTTLAVCNLVTLSTISHEAAGTTFNVDVYLNGVLNKTLSYKADCCFAAGTLILTSLDGKTKNIEDIQVGDDVVSYDNVTLQNYIAKVKKTIIKQNIIDIAVLTLEDGKTVTMHTYHPILTEDGWHSLTNYCDMPTLEIGDVVKTDTGWSKLIDVNKYIDDKEWTMYNLDVVDDLEDPDQDEDDNYFANGICAHNAPC